MGRPNLIDKLGLGAQVLALAATMGSRAIAARLQAEGHQVSHSAVHRYLEDRLQERAEATAHVRAAVQEQIQAHALSDVDMLGRLKDQLALDVFGDPERGVECLADYGQRIKAVRELRATLELRLKISGAGGEAGGIDYREVVREEMQRLAATVPRTLEEITERFPLPPAPPGVSGSE